MRLAVFGAAVQQILAPVLIFPRGFGGFGAADSVPSPAEPAAYAFGIWGVIYTSCLIYGVLQLLPRYANMHSFAAIRRPTVILFIGSTVWLLFAKFGPNWMTVPVIGVMAAAALIAMLRLARWETPLPRQVKLMVGWPVAIYAGWLSVAAFVNAATVLPFWGTGTAGLGAGGLAVLVVTLAAGIAAAVVVRSRGALAYALAVSWGLAGVAAANSGHSKGEALSGRIFDNGAPDERAALWAALAAIALIVAALGAARARRPQHHRALRVKAA